MEHFIYHFTGIKFLTISQIKNVCIRTDRRELIQSLCSSFRDSLYFTAGPESMLVKIEHAVLATKLFSGGTDLAASQRKMKGYLIGHDGKVLRRQITLYL